MSNLLRAEGVSYQVNGRSILSDIDLSFETGSNTTIVGPSGSGKSTFIMILTTLIVMKGLDMVAKKVDRREANHA